MKAPRNPKRIPRILKKLQDLWEEYPDLRLGQLIMNIDGTNKDFFHVEDTEWEKRISRCRKEWKEHTGDYKKAEQELRKVLKAGKPAIVATQGESGYQQIFDVLTDRNEDEKE